MGGLIYSPGGVRTQQLTLTLVPAAANPRDSSFLPFTAKTHTYPPDSACCELTPAYMVFPALLHLASLCPGHPGVAERVRLILLCTPRTGTGLLSEKHLEEQKDGQKDWVDMGKKLGHL